MEYYCQPHAFCPENHLMLGIQIGYIALLLPLALFGTYCGYLIMDRGNSRIELGRCSSGVGVFLAGIVVTMSSAGVIPGAGFWLAFEGGLRRVVVVGGQLLGTG